jgi:hypothetical protein
MRGLPRYIITLTDIDEKESPVIDEGINRG